HFLERLAGGDAGRDLVPELLDVATKRGDVLSGADRPVRGDRHVEVERFDGSDLGQPVVEVIALEGAEGHPPQADDVANENRSLLGEAQRRQIGRVLRAEMDQLAALAAEANRLSVHKETLRRMYVVQWTPLDRRAAQGAVA